MSLGLVAVLILIQIDHPYKVFIAVSLIVLGAFADFFDGFFARKLEATSALGKELDSFADIITFGVAPVLLINYTDSYTIPFVLILSSLFYIVAGAYRLARFNLSDFKDYFLGLPIPVAGVSLALYSGVSFFWQFNYCFIITPIFVTVLSILMVSPKKIRRITFRKPKL